MDPITLMPAHHFPARPRLATSRSTSRSPSRRKHFTNSELNPLPSDLSPSSTLDALQVNDIVRTGGKPGKSFIQESVASASTSERAWGIKAALAGKKVREWYLEVKEWTWPGFNQPPLEEPIKRRAQYHKEGHVGSSLSAEATRSNGCNSESQTVGALSSKLVQEYEERIEMIRDNMETLEIEDLKDYVLNTHFKAGSRRSSLHDPQAISALPTDYDHLDDFTTVITATIMQALPTISRLETLLNTWSTRLLVLRQIPSFLTDLDAGRQSMISSSIAIGIYDSQHTKPRSDFSLKAFLDIRAFLKDQIAELGHRLDRMLDLLEGSADTLPDAWVDDLDTMEKEYSAWVMKAECLAMTKEFGVGRLEKDYTRDHTDELLYLDRPLDIRHTTSTLDIGAQFDEIRQRADSEFDLTRQIPLKTAESENESLQSSTEPFAGPFSPEPFSSRGALPEQGFSNKAQARGPLVSSIDGQSLDGLKTSSLPSRLSHRPIPLMLAGSRANVKRLNSPDAASDTSGSGSATSNYSSNRSSPRIQSAVVAEYMGSPVEVTSLMSSNREPITPLDLSFRRPSQRAEGDGARIRQSGVPSDLVPKNTPSYGGSGHVRTRSASLQSFEIVPKHEIRRVQVRRSGSYSSAISLSNPEDGLVQPSRLPTSSAPRHGEPEAFCTDTPLLASRKLRDQPSSPPAQNLDPGPDIPRRRPLYHPPPPVSAKSSTSAKSSHRESYVPKQQLPYHSPPVVPPRPAPPAQKVDRELDMTEHQIPYHSPPPVPPRSAHRFEQVSDLGPGFTPVKIRQMKISDTTGGHASGHVETPRTTARLFPGNIDNQLEERISSILTQLPTHIRLTSGPEPDAPEVMHFNSHSDLRTPKTRSPAWRLNGVQTSNPLPLMTLAPAQPKSSKSRSLTGSPDIKLYHLHQTGKTAPIKLFVRLVGEEGERVMVRIGGGWADLGEYLKEYAIHHGRRSVSDSTFDIQGLSSSSITTHSSPRSRPGSRPTSPTPKTKTSPAVTFQRQQTSPAIFDTPRTPQSDSSLRTSSHVSWAGVDEVSPSLGLAGPKTKNVDISPRKQAWVDEMVEQARHSGTEKKGSESAVGDLGKVGGTQRVFFKSRKEG